MKEEGAQPPWLRAFFWLKADTPVATSNGDLCCNIVHRFLTAYILLRLVVMCCVTFGRAKSF
jgi:hypothetical protein